MGMGMSWWTRDGQRPHRGLSASLTVTITLASMAAISGTASAHAAGSAHPDDWTRLIWILVIMATGVAAVVYGLMVLALWRYRESSFYIRKEPKVHDTKLESVWTVIPVILVAVIVVLSLQVMQTTDDLPEEGIRIQVIGRQYEWTFIYPDNTTTKNDIWVEEGQTVIFEITATDVIHSFFLPDFYLKVDAIPNVVDEAFIIAEPAGEYEIYCAEFCGDIHSEMLGTLYIYPEGANDGKPWGPPPGEVPPPPEIEEVHMDLEIREDGGPDETRPWSINPSTIQLPLDAEVSFRVWNNGTASHSLSLAPPYGRYVGAIPPGEFRYLNFTADMPTAGTVCFCDEDDHLERGLQAKVVVVDTGEGDGALVPPPTFPWVPSLYGVAFVLFGALFVAAMRPPSRPEPHVIGTDEDTGEEPTEEDTGEDVEEEGEPKGGEGG